jgi:fluoroquinolone transport system permease protein
MDPGDLALESAGVRPLHHHAARSTLTVRATRVLRALGPIDAKSVRRDAMLRWLAAYPIAVALLLRWGVPALSNTVRVRADVDLVPYYPLFVSFLVLAVPTITGIVIGFLLLDQRDDQTLTALRVTPLPLNSYLAYRIVIPMALSVVMTVVAVPLTGLAGIGFLPLSIVAVGAAPLAPMQALFLAGFARNKVQGFALTKGAGVLLWPPMLAYFIDSRWQYAAGVVPQYWPVKSFWMLQAGEPNAWVCLLVGTVYQLLLLVLLLRRFNMALQR